jgi:hypothetical protein
MGLSPAAAKGEKASKVAGEQVLPSRLFEGAAGGAVILGTAPQCPEFRECFDWPDAVIEVDPDSSDLATVIEQLDAQPRRMERVRQTNAVRCLQQHDWVYRWERILSAAGIDPLPQLKHRKSQLSELAATIMSAAAA